MHSGSRLAWLLLGTVALLAQPVTFAPGPEIRIAEPLPAAFSVAVADVNQDGLPDLLVGTSAGLVVLFNDGESHFMPGNLFPAPPEAGPLNLRTGDFDGDGILDVAAYAFRTGLLLIYRGSGDGGFELATTITAKAGATETHGIVAADLNQDGVLDLAIGQPGNVSVLFGGGDGTFQAPAELPIGSAYGGGNPAALIAADFNGDGIPDLASVNLVSNDDLSILLGTGGGRFREEVRLRPGCRPYDLAAVDYNRDGAVDLAVACDEGLVLFAGKGDGSFTAGPRQRSDSSSMSVAAGDLNGDGLIDFVLGNYYGGKISVLLGRPDGSWSAADSVWALGDVFSVALADLNGDGLPDLAAASYSSSTVLVATGRGDGQFEPPIYFGASPGNGFKLRATGPGGGVVLVADGRKLVALVERGGEMTNTIRTTGYPIDAQVADFNRDGIPDLALVTVRRLTGRREAEFGAAIQLLPGLPGGGFGDAITTAVDQCAVSSPPSSPLASSCISFSGARGLLRLGAGDFNGDGIPDLALFNLPSGHLQIYAGNGDGSFRPADRVPSLALTVVAADFDGDKVTDLALRSGDGLGVVILAGNSAGPLRETGTYRACRTPPATDLATGDFNGDGKPDLVVYCGREAAVLLNAGSGKFQEPVYTAPPAVLAFTPAIVADFNQDGKDDLLAVSSTALALLVSKGDGSFAEPVPVPAPRVVAALAAADLAGDSRPDAVLIDGSSGTLKILINGPAAAAP